MDKNDTIEIRAVTNGYIVSEGFNIAKGPRSVQDAVLVFQSYTELEEFLREHFTYRNSSIEND